MESAAQLCVFSQGVLPLPADPISAADKKIKVKGCRIPIRSKNRAIPSRNSRHPLTVLNSGDNRLDVPEAPKGSRAPECMVPERLWTLRKLPLL